MPLTGREENLVKFTAESAKERGSAGGKKSAQTKREKRDLQRQFQALLEGTYKVPARDEKTGKVKVNKMGQPVQKSVSGAEMLALQVMNKALKGDLTAFVLVRDTAGQKPVERVLTAEVPPETFAEVEDLVNEALDENDPDAEAAE